MAQQLSPGFENLRFCVKYVTSKKGGIGGSPRKTKSKKPEKIFFFAEASASALVRITCALGY